MEQKSLVSLIVKNEKGVLATISELLSEADINVEKLVASSIDVEGKISKMIFYITGNRVTINDFFKENIEKLPVVLNYSNFTTSGGFIEKELLMIKVLQTNSNFSDINSLLSASEGKIIFIDKNIVVYEIISDNDKLDEIMEKLSLLTKDIEISRSGLVAMDFSNKTNHYELYE